MPSKQQLEIENEELRSQVADLEEKLDDVRSIIAGDEEDEDEDEEEEEGTAVEASDVEEEDEDEDEDEDESDDAAHADDEVEVTTRIKRNGRSRR